MSINSEVNAVQISPYLSNPGRLGDVIAAIQVMAVYKFYKLPFDKWADRISADPTQAEKWKKVFLEHPEFFRLDSARERASLVWRRQFPKLYAVDQQKVLSYEEYRNLDQVAQARVSRVPLAPSDIKALIDTAINLHSRALEYRKDKRWWTAIAGAVGGLLGSILGALASG